MYEKRGDSTRYILSHVFSVLFVPRVGKAGLSFNLVSPTHMGNHLFRPNDFFIRPLISFSPRQLPMGYCTAELLPALREEPHAVPDELRVA